MTVVDQASRLDEWASPPRLETDPETYLAIHAVLDEEVTDGLLAPAELQFRQRVRDVVAAEVAPRAAAADRDHTFVGDSYQALVDAGLVGVLFPRGLGGLGLDTASYATAMEEITAGCPATSLVYMTQTHAAYPITLQGTPELVETYVPPLLDGRAFGSMAITEPGAGSDASLLRTTAVRRGDEYVLNGSKTFITTGDRSDVIVCFATTDASGGRAAVSAFVVRGDRPGLTRGQPMHKMGMHGSTTAELFFDDTPVPADHILGAEGSGWSLLTKAVVKSRISAAAQGVGLARGAYAHGLTLLQQLYGHALPQQIGDRLADLRGRILQGRLLLLATARLVDARPEHTPTASIAMMKQHCTDSGFAVAAEIVRLLGPVGDLVDMGAERYLRDSKVTQIYDGTNEIQRLLVARDTARSLRKVEVR